jgi:phosphoenolpyruvate carboxykinase (ATP)
VPKAIPDVPSAVLDARGTWPSADEYDAQAKKLAAMFRENFAKFGGEVSAAIAGAGPKG